MNDRKVKRIKYEALIGHNLSFHRYMENYYNASIAMFEYIENSDYDINHLIYPLLYTCRHYLELGFKANILYFVKFSETEFKRVLKTHNLIELYSEFQKQISITLGKSSILSGLDINEDDKTEFNMYFNKVAVLAKNFEELDTNSIGFRYPYDKNGDPLFNDVKRLNMLEIRETLIQARVLLNHTVDVFAPYTDYIEMIDDYYKQAHYSQY